MSSLTLANIVTHKNHNMLLQEEQLVVSKDHTQQIIKGKRRKRQRVPSPLSLAMPSTSNGSSVNNSLGYDSATTSPTTTVDELREEDQDMANCLILLAQGHHHNQIATPTHTHVPTPHCNSSTNNNNKSSLYLYQCKTCNRCFSSFQALGGHRASHKKPKQNGSLNEEKQCEEVIDHNYDPSTSTTLSLQISNTSCTTNSTAKGKVHECSICGAEFSSGQALGGHMRRHRSFVNTSMTICGNNVIGGGDESREAKKRPLNLDLNLPAPKDDHRESKYSFQPRENVIVFSSSSLVDCHY